MKPIKLKDIFEQLEIQSDEFRQYLNKQTGEIVTVSSEDLSIAEDSDEDDDFLEYPEWQRDSIKAALDIIVNWDNYIALPDKCDINEYDIMENFCGSVENEGVSNALYSAIRGRGVFRRFKDSVSRFGIENDWYKFRDEALKKVAIQWCEDNEITYIE